MALVDRRSLGRAARLLAPVITLAGAAGCILFYFRIADSGTDSSQATALPLPIGIYVSAEDSRALASLSGSSQQGAKWHVEVAAYTDQTADVTVSYGELGLNEFGTAYGTNASRPLQGTLAHSVTIVYTLPALSPHGAQSGGLYRDLTSWRDPSLCASWTDSAGKHVQVHTVWDRGSDGYPDAAVCTIPAVSEAQDIDIYSASTVGAQALQQSFDGKSTLSISNPQTLQTMMDQQLVPQRLLDTPGAAYSLSVHPPRGDVFSATEPPAERAGPLGVRGWTVRAGAFVASDLVDEHKQTVADVAQQLLLILGGFFFGLFASTATVAVRALRRARPDAPLP